MLKYTDWVKLLYKLVSLSFLFDSFKTIYREIDKTNRLIFAINFTTTKLIELTTITIQ